MRCFVPAVLLPLSCVGAEPPASDPEPPRFVGEVEVENLYDDELLCAFSASLVGEPYEGSCEGCEFAFEIQAEITGGEACEDVDVNVRYGWVMQEAYAEYPLTPLLAYAPTLTFDRHGDPTEEEQEQAFLSGWVYAEGPYADGAERYGQWYVLSAAGSDRGTFTRSGDEIAWSFDYSEGSEGGGAGYTVHASGHGALE